MVYSKTFYFATEQEAERLEPQILAFISKNGFNGFQEISNEQPVEEPVEESKE